MGPAGTNVVFFFSQIISKLNLEWKVLPKDGHIQDLVFQNPNNIFDFQKKVMKVDQLRLVVQIQKIRLPFFFLIFHCFHILRIRLDNYFSSIQSYLLIEKKTKNYTSLGPHVYVSYQFKADSTKCTRNNLSQVLE